MFCLYIVALLARLLAPDVPDAPAYFYAIAVYRGALEAAPACLAVGFAAGLLGDLMLRWTSNDDADSSH